MKIDTLQSKLPKSKLVMYLVLFFFAILMTVALLLFNVLDAERGRNALIGVITTLLIISCVELVPEGVRWVGERLRRGQFMKLFGEAAFQNDVRLVFAHRHINPESKPYPWITHYSSQKAKSPCVAQCSAIDQCPSNAQCPGVVKGPRIAEGVNAWLAFQDVRAAVYLSNTISEMTGRQVSFIHDKDAEAGSKDYCAISLGLGFNGFTHQIEGYFKKPLFKIVWGKSPKNPEILTDLFIINGFDISIPPPEQDLAIVARIVPRPDKACASRVWFVCAGRTAAGTSAAGYFLAKEWQQLMNLYKKNSKNINKDSLVVVIQHKESENEGYDYDSTAEIAQIDGTQVVGWGRVSGIS